MNGDQNLSASILDRAITLEQLGRHEEAIATYRQVLGGEADAMIWNFISANYSHLERYAEAKQASEMAISLEPHDDEVLQNLAVAQYGLGELKAAEKTLDAALELNPENTSLLHILALVYLRNDQYDKATSIIDRGLQIDPQHPGLQKARIHLFAKDNNELGLHHHVNVLLSNDPTEADLIAWKALLWCNSGLFDNAEEMALQALSIDPVNEKAKYALLLCYKHKNGLLRFFVGKAFRTYVIKWSLPNIIILIICIKGVALWGGFFVLYMLITWIGGVAYNTWARTSSKLRLILSKRQVQQSNYLLISLGVIGTLLTYQLLHPDQIILRFILISTFLLFAGISYFELYSKLKKILFFCTVTVLISISLAFLHTDSTGLYIAVITLITILYGVLFTFKVIGE